MQHNGSILVLSKKMREYRLKKGHGKFLANLYSYDLIAFAIGMKSVKHIIDKRNGYKNYIFFRYFRH